MSDEMFVEKNLEISWSSSIVRQLVKRGRCIKEETTGKE
jgi:hypothetical protein